MTHGIHPKLLPRGEWLSELLLTFDYMTQQGNMMATVRKAEIEELARVQWNCQVIHHRFSGLNYTSAGLSQTPLSLDSLPTLGDAFFDQWATNDGLSSAQLFSLADALNSTTDVDLLAL